MTKSRSIWGFRVKGGSRKDWFNKAIEENRILYGWSNFPLDEWSSQGGNIWNYERIKIRLTECCSDFIKSPYSLGAYASMLWNYLFDMSGDDLVVVPTYGIIAIGRLTGEIGHENEEFYTEEDIANWRGVNWILKVIDRSELTSALQGALKNRRTIFLLNDYISEIDDIVNKADIGSEISFSTDYKLTVSRERNTILDELMEKISKGKTYITPTGFEDLIAELLKLESNLFFDTRKSSNVEEANHGADIIAKSISTVFDIKLKIQIEMNYGVTNEDKIEQITKRKDRFDVLPVVATSGTFSQEAEALSEERGVMLIDGRQISDMILRHFDKLSDDTKAKIGFMKILQFTK